MMKLIQISLNIAILIEIVILKIMENTQMALHFMADLIQFLNIVLLGITAKGALMLMIISNIPLLM